jgi:S1-C subfamily serine protease
MKEQLASHYPLTHLKTILLLLFVATIAFASGLILTPSLTGAALATEQPAQSSESPLEAEILAVYNNALAKIYEETVPAVVKLDITRPGADNKLVKGQGSGFIWDNTGHIVTNAHTVQGAKRIIVTFVDGSSLEAEVWGTDPLADLAVLKVDPSSVALHPVALGDSSSIKVGQLALAIGAPFGQEFTMTRGIISAMNRTIRTCESCFPIPNTIQMDTPINPGNSGGPLFNQRGEVIGINTMVISLNDANTGISFAISIDIAKQIVPSLIENRPRNE